MYCRSVVNSFQVAPESNRAIACGANAGIPQLTERSMSGMDTEVRKRFIVSSIPSRKSGSSACRRIESPAMFTPAVWSDCDEASMAIDSVRFQDPELEQPPRRMLQFGPPGPAVPAVLQAPNTA